MNLEICRSYTDQQLKDIQALIDSCNKSDRTGYVFDGSDDFRSPEDIAACLLYRGDRLVSAITIFAPMPEKEAELYLFTHPDFRRQGLAAELMETVNTELVRRNIPSILYVCDGASETGRLFCENRKSVHDFSEFRLVYQRERDNDSPNPKKRIRKGEVTLEKAVAEDLPRLAEINAAAFNEKLEYSQDILNKAFDSKVRTFYSVKADQTLVGMVGVYHETSEQYIHGFCIDPSLQGKGIGRKALRTLVNQIRRDLPESEIVLEVETMNKNALGLYEDTGFKVVTEFLYYRESRENGNH